MELGKPCAGKPPARFDEGSEAQTAAQANSLPPRSLLAYSTRRLRTSLVKASTVILLLLAVYSVGGAPAASKREYPYHASVERRTSILDGAKRIRVGMAATDVQRIMGHPDEINDTYEPRIKAARKIGYSYVYLLQRLRETGSANDKDEKLIRLHFKFDDRLNCIDNETK